MLAELVFYGFALLVVVTVIAIGAYIGTMRALERYHSGKGSVFLSTGDRNARE